MWGHAGTLGNGLPCTSSTVHDSTWYVLNNPVLCKTLTSITGIHKYIPWVLEFMTCQRRKIISSWPNALLGRDLRMAFPKAARWFPRCILHANQRQIGQDSREKDDGTSTENKLDHPIPHVILFLLHHATLLWTASRKKHLRQVIQIVPIQRSLLGVNSESTPLLQAAGSSLSVTFIERNGIGFRLLSWQKI